MPRPALGETWAGSASSSAPSARKSVTRNPVCGCSRPPYRLAKTNARDENSLYYYFEDQARKSADREMFRCEDVSLTWREVELRAWSSSVGEGYAADTHAPQRLHNSLTSLWHAE